MAPSRPQHGGLPDAAAESASSEEPGSRQRSDEPGEARQRSFLEALDEVSEAVESGAGLPAVARAAARALDASVIVLDASSAVLAVACASRRSS